MFWLEILANGMDHIRNIMSQPLIAELVAEEIEPGIEANTKVLLDSYLRSMTWTVYHPAGTCRMGADENAVVDPKLKVSGS